MNFKAPKFYMLCLCLTVLLVPMTASAMEEQCVENQTTEITDLRAPVYGSSRNSWDVLYAGDGLDVFKDVLPLDEKNFVAVGYYTKNKDDKIQRPLMVKYDDLFKPVWESKDEVSNSRTIEHILKSKIGYTVLGDLKNSKNQNGIYIASYYDTGKLKTKPAPVFEKGGSVRAKTFIESQDADGYIIAAQYMGEVENNSKQYGVLYKVSFDGKVIWRRTFQTGQDNSINDVRATLDGNYVVVGQVVTGDNKSAGWVIRLDREGAIEWQQTYPRGLSASFQSVAQSKEGDFILTGKSRPFDFKGESLAAWVIKIDRSGKQKWERFFRGDYSYEAPDLIVYADGRASVLLSATSMGGKARSHARLITFTPQGNVDKLEDYVEGQNATATRLVSGANAERILVGHAQTSFGENQKGNHVSEAPEYTYDAWVLAATPLGAYKDPCIFQPVMSPLLP